jgi:hypothetical protein
MSKMQKGIAAVIAGLGLILAGAGLVKWGVGTIREELKAKGQADTIGFDKKSDLAEPVQLASVQETGIWTLTWRDAQGNVKATEVLHNTLSRVADQRMLELQFRGGAAPGASYYIGLADATNPCSITKTDSTATAWTGEPSGNGYARVAVSKDGTGWPTSAASSNDWHIVSKVVTFTSTGTIGPVNCALLSDQASGTAGDWHAWVALSQARTMANGESLDCSLDITLAYLGLDKLDHYARLLFLPWEG